ncbi:MAG: hypothetical protein B7Y39_08900 [Bdellovibrio sp. 28-41-41]|nr:MAG: hypothetical protein B7Y39_08900 [Bdellovibrio sp. 28-41-41]
MSELLVNLLFAAVAFSALLIVVTYLLINRRLRFCRKASDTLIKEFVVSRPAQLLIPRAKDLGFTSFYLVDKESGKIHSKEVWNDAPGVNLIDLQKKISEIKNLTLDTQIIAVPPFLRWNVRFEIESGVIKSIRRLDLD